MIGTASATGSIVNDDGAVAIAATSASKAEGNSGSTAYTFTVTRSGDTSTAQSVDYVVAGSGASAASATDFTGNALPSGTVSFAAGDTSKIITINVAGDTTTEADEGFTVTLSNASTGLVIGTASATGSIVNDDATTTLRSTPDAYITLNNAYLFAPLSASVLLNDTAALRASQLTTTTNGTLYFSEDGTFGYIPQIDYNGIDKFYYRSIDSNNDGEYSYVKLHVIPTIEFENETLDLISLSPEQQIAATYVAFFGRGADASGFEFWINEFYRGINELEKTPKQLFADIASSFGVSEEAKSLYSFLANPTQATDIDISVFLSTVYDNLFNRSPDADGLLYWTGRVRAVLAEGVYVGNVLVDIMSGTQNSAAGKDITTLMSKVAVGLHYVEEGARQGTEWTWADDQAEAMDLIDKVTDAPATVLLGIAEAQALIEADLVG